MHGIMLFGSYLSRLQLNSATTSEKCFISNRGELGENETSRNRVRGLESVRNRTKTGRMRIKWCKSLE